MERREWPQACEVFEQALAVDPGFVIARRNLGTNFAGVTNGDTDFSIFSFLNNLTSLDDAGDMLLLSKRVNLAASIANGSDSLDIFMEAIQERGLAKVLAEPTLTARTGEPEREIHEFHRATSYGARAFQFKALRMVSLSSPGTSGFAMNP